MTVPQSLESLDQQRASIANQIATVGDLRSGSITCTTGRCGKPTATAIHPKIRGMARTSA